MRHSSPTAILLNIGHAMDHWLIRGLRLHLASSPGVGRRMDGAHPVQLRRALHVRRGLDRERAAGRPVRRRRWIMMVIFFAGMGVSALIIALCSNKWQIGMRSP